MKKYLIGLTIILFVITNSAWGLSIDCNTTDATANGVDASSCYGDDWVSFSNSNPETEASFINTTLGSLADPFEYVAKYENSKGPESGMPGWTLTVTESTDQDYSFAYSLLAPDALKGTTVDFVLGVKQANDSFIAYLFESVVLDVDGFFNSSWKNPAGKETIDYSHVIAFVQGAAPVPEPSTLLLLGSGIFGLALYGRKRKKA